MSHHSESILNKYVTPWISWVALGVLFLISVTVGFVTLSQQSLVASPGGSAEPHEESMGMDTGGFKPVLTTFTCEDVRRLPAGAMQFPEYHPHRFDISNQLETRKMLEVRDFDCYWRAYRYLQAMRDGSPSALQVQMDNYLVQARSWSLSALQKYRDDTIAVIKTPRDRNGIYFINSGGYAWGYPGNGLGKIAEGLRLNPEWAKAHPNPEVIRLVGLRLQTNRQGKAELVWENTPLPQPKPLTQADIAKQKFGAITNKMKFAPLTQEELTVLDRAEQLHQDWQEAALARRPDSELEEIVMMHHDSHRQLEAMAKTPDQQNLFMLTEHSPHDICRDRSDEELDGLIKEVAKAHKAWTLSVKRLDFEGAWQTGLMHARAHALLATCNIKLPPIVEQVFPEPFPVEEYMPLETTSSFSCEDIRGGQVIDIHPKTGQIMTQDERRDFMDTRLFDCFWRAYRYAQEYKAGSPANLQPQIQARMNEALQFVQNAMRTYKNEVTFALGANPGIRKDHFFDKSYTTMGEAIPRLASAFSLNPQWVIQHPNDEAGKFLNLRILQRIAGTSDFISASIGQVRPTVQTHPIANANRVIRAIHNQMTFEPLPSQATSAIDQLAQAHQAWIQALKTNSDSATTEQLGKSYLTAFRALQGLSGLSDNQKVLLDLAGHTLADACPNHSVNERSTLLAASEQTFAQWVQAVKRAVKASDFTNTWLAGVRHARVHALLSTCGVTLPPL